MDTINRFAKPHMSKTVNSNTLLSGIEDSSTDEAQPKCYVMRPQEEDEQMTMLPTKLTMLPTKLVNES